MELYRLFDAQERLLYVGISMSTMCRMTQHRLAKSWWDEVATVRIEHLDVGLRTEAEAIERAAIIAEQPLHNVNGNVPEIERRAALDAACAAFMAPLEVPEPAVSVAMRQYFRSHPDSTADELAAEVTRLVESS